MSRPILLEHRRREIERPFGWIPLRLVRDGYWAELSAEAKILYCLLCIVSDRRGISFYGDARLQHDTGLDRHNLARARDELVDHDLIAIDAASPTVQLLSLPCKHREGLVGRPAAPRTVVQARVVPPTPPPNTSTEKQLQAVRQLISHLTTDKRQTESRSQTHATQK